MTIRGHLGGVAIHDHYGASKCSLVGKRWLRDLRDARVLPETAASLREAREERRRGRNRLVFVSE